MYTQCPDCGVAFRVTADVLKQAAGKVRCGGCGVAFNALKHLSEDKPDAPTPAAPDPAVPELTPEQPAELTADTPPQSISAEQSAALLKTLDQLAGEDIRIEDTGVEWRVIDDDDIDEGAAIPVDPEPSQSIDEMRFDDNTPLPEDFDYEPSPSPAPVKTPAPEPEAEPVATQADLAFGEPEEWDDLLGEVESPAAAQDAQIAEAVDDLDELEDLDEELQRVALAKQEEAETKLVSAGADDDVPLDMDTQFQLQAEAMGIDISGMHAEADDEVDAAEAELDSDDDKLDTSIEEDLIAAAFEAEAAVKEMEDSGTRAALGDDAKAEDELEEEDEPEVELEIDLQEEDEEQVEDDVEDIAMGFDDKVEEAIETIEASFEIEKPDFAAERETKADLELALDDDDVAEALSVPDRTDEEKTIDRMIDEELLAIAVEDEEGFASTIVQVQPDEEKIHEEKKGKAKDKKDKTKKKQDKAAKPRKGPPPIVETIVMEGEDVRDAVDIPGNDDFGGEDPGLSIPLAKADDDYSRRGDMNFARPSAGMIAGAVGLVLLLLLQLMHQSREALATVPAFNSAVGPVYRMLGMPLTPTWDIQGWRFEATKGDVDESGVLTIYSRVGNKSQEDLPYPLVHLALTDRFEESMGSTVLEPSDYLPENSDPSRLVPPGNTFNAVISIESPSPDATSFKLNVCYRLASSRLRCQDASFK